MLGAPDLLELAGRIGAKILQASTTEVYGNGAVNPIGIRSNLNEGLMKDRLCFARLLLIVRAAGASG